ncbi:MAG TPA: hypothetical protein DGU38_12220 [Parabacteroides merdae]|jgi:integrase family protein|uniref:site-specific integrase n=1 Tax=Parabacteroides merdae TaxID=46503 RepID=UPI000E98064E|nr:hypothetical protein [Parabacteroides merdae]HCW16074.1 hypothetical protein [Parabacteroides merdae]
MATVKFYLTRPQSDKPTAIYFLLNYGAFTIQPNGKKKYLPLKYYTNESILPEKWDAKAGAPIAPTAKNKRINSIEYKELKAALDNIEATAKDVLRRLENDGQPITNELLTCELDKIYKSYKEVEVIKTDDLLSFIDDYIQNTDKKKPTIKQYKIVRNNIFEYAELMRKRPTFDDIDLDYYLGFVEFLTAKGYSPNTIGSRVKGLKLFMNEAYERDLHTNLDFKKKRFSKPKEETNSVYLNNDELLKIYNCDFSKRKKLDRVRDIFLIGCYTGLRFSDLSQLKSDNISEDGTITVKTQKTGKTVVIPIHTIVRTILAKYNNELPKMLSNQKFNDYIKEVAKAADIDESIFLQTTKGGLSYTETVPKYSLVTSHTARRSFATNAFLAGVPTISIMKITGHKTESAFMKYIKISDKENAIQLKAHKFFNQMVVSK